MIKKKTKKKNKDIFGQNYWQFSKHVLKVIFKQRKFFLKLIILSSVVSIFLLGVMPQTSYNSFRKIIDRQQVGDGPFLAVKKSTTMLVSIFDTGGFAIGNDQVKSIYFTLIMLLLWLAVVKQLRFSLAGEEKTFKEIIYSCGGPIISLSLNFLLLLLKLIPSAILIIVYASLTKSIFFENFWNVTIINTITLLLISLNIYWLIPSIISLAVVTLPKMYPLEAIYVSKSLVEGQRFKIILRLLWHFVNVGLLWLIIMVPIIMIDNFVVSKVKFLSLIPVVSLSMIIISIVSSVWTFVYIYIIYRRLMENDQSFN